MNRLLAATSLIGLLLLTACEPSETNERPVVPVEPVQRADAQQPAPVDDPKPGTSPGSGSDGGSEDAARSTGDGTSVAGSGSDGSDRPGTGATSNVDVVPGVDTKEGGGGEPVPSSSQESGGAGAGVNVAEDDRAGKTDAGIDVDPLVVVLLSRGDKHQFQRGELVDLLVMTNRDAHLYCYLQDEKKQVMRIFPNRWVKESFVKGEKLLALPGQMRFQIVMNDKGVVEQVACLATTEDVSAALPAEAFGGDFEALPLGDIDQVNDAFRQVAKGVLTRGDFSIVPQ